MIIVHMAYLIMSLVSRLFPESAMLPLGAFWNEHCWALQQGHINQCSVQSLLR